ncbi:MAG TPA: hypothetical protein VHK70_08675, partial [Burkholderiaceae bacterium]|nr:hypothetical protein [Burkholderiaceae bacterium]
MIIAAPLSVPTIQAREKPRALPVFLQTRMEGYYVERVQKLWSGGHLLHGRIPGEGAIHLSSNDYLCLSGQPELVRAQSASLVTNGSDLLMSSVFLHGDNPQSRFEKKLAAHMGSEDGIISQSGWNANVGLIQTLANPQVPVYLDMMAHASLWEGAHAADARAIPFLHNDPAHLERQIQKSGPGIIAVDSVYSTNGSVCPIPEIL